MEFKDISGPLPPAIGGDEKPEYPQPYASEEERIKDMQRKRWRIVEKLRQRRLVQQRQARERERRRLEHFRLNYDIVAHFIIDAVADMESDPVRREERRTRLERRLHVRKIPRITGPGVRPTDPVRTRGVPRR